MGLGVDGQKETKPEPIEERTYRFALRVLKLVSSMPPTVAATVLGRQVLRSATSIGANVEEAKGASSRRDFTNKMTIALKEARETHYWLRLIRDTETFDEERMAPIVQEAMEIKKILSVTVKTARDHPDRHA
jgi:four helix bundle protein